jgi:hypothetical protein
MAGSGGTLVRREQEGFDWSRLDLHEYVEALFEGRPVDQFTVVASATGVPSSRHRSGSTLRTWRASGASTIRRTR